MDKLSVSGLVIKEDHTGESDRIVTVLTKSHGLIRAFATGARSIKSKRAAGTQLLSYSDFVFTFSKDTYRVSEASPIEVFFELRGDIEKLTVAQYFCEIAGVLVNEDEDSGDILRIILNSLSFLISGRHTPRMIKAITELRLMAESGFMPDLSGCTACGKTDDERFFFDTSTAELYCSECARGRHGLAELGGAVIAAMRHICYSELKKLYSFTLTDDCERNLAAVCEKYLLCQTDRFYQTLNFYHTLN